jgi:DNA end-binding protein Ku
MAARSIWSGTISFGLISIPVKLFTAVRHKAVSFNQLDDRNMGRIRYQKVSEADARSFRRSTSSRASR